MNAKQIVETFSKKDPNEFFIIAWYEAGEFIDEADGITQEVWDKKAPDYRLAYDSEEYSIIQEYLQDA
jgi:hypothetical protein